MSVKDMLRLFVPLTKVDEAKRLVYGVIADESPDHAAEIFDYATSKPLFQAWSGDIEKSTDGKSVGNVRAMHGHVAAGKLTSIDFDDGAKSIQACAKVVDDAEWNKVLEGVYTGFSIGGKYLKRWADGDNTRYTAQPVEVSLVDLPCMPNATFAVVKADGSSDLRKFKDIDPAVKAKAIDLAKAAGDEGLWADHIEKAHEVLAPAEGDGLDASGEEYEQVWKSKIDGATFKKKAELIAHNAKLKTDADAATLATNVDPVQLGKDILAALDAKKPAAKAVDSEEMKKLIADGIAMKNGTAVIAKKEDMTDAILLHVTAPNKMALQRHIVKRAVALGAVDILPDGWAHKAPAAKLAKGASLYFVASMIRLLAEMESVEEDYESGWGTIVADKALSDRFGSLLVEFGDIAAEILDTCLSSTKEEEASEMMVMANQVTDLVKAVTGKHKEGLQKAHDILAGMGAGCKADKAAIGTDLAKVLAERDELTKTVTDMTTLLKDIHARVKNIEEQPSGTSLPSSLKVVSKESDIDPALVERLGSMSPEQVNEMLSTLAIKMSQQQPHAITSRGR